MSDMREAILNADFDWYPLTSMFTEHYGSWIKTHSVIFEKSAYYSSWASRLRGWLFDARTRDVPIDGRDIPIDADNRLREGDILYHPARQIYCRIYSHGEILMRFYEILPSRWMSIKSKIFFFKWIDAIRERKYDEGYD